MSGFWKAACRQRSRREFVVVQDESTQPRASSAFWSASASDGRGVSSNSVTVWWLGRGRHKGRAMFENQLRVLFGDPKVALELARKEITLRIASKVALPKCVSRVCFFAILMDSWAEKR